MTDLGPRGDIPTESFMAAYFRLRVAVESACRTERIGATTLNWSVQAAAEIRAVLTWAEADPAAANVLTNEALARGRAGFSDYDRMLNHFAALLYAGRRERPEGGELPEITEKAMVGGLAMLIAHYLDRERAAELPDLAPEAIQFILTPFVGAEEARQMARYDDVER
jgi:hypothetical protein